MAKKIKSKKRKLSINHKRKISNSLKKYHKTCKKPIKKTKYEKEMDEFLAGIEPGDTKKQLLKEINKLKKMIKKSH